MIDMYAHAHENNDIGHAMTNANPFREFLKSANNCAPESRGRFIANEIAALDDTTHDGNPFEHTEITDPATFAEYLEWDGDGVVEDVDACLTWLKDAAAAYDLMIPHLEPDDCGGQQIESRDVFDSEPWTNPNLHDTYEITISVNDDELDPEGILGVTLYTVTIINHEPVDLTITRP